ncbi:hypothetical protein U1Q18_024011 [Sarracenia purpurea var. burkii]
MVHLALGWFGGGVALLGWGAGGLPLGGGVVPGWIASGLGCWWLGLLGKLEGWVQGRLLVGLGVGGVAGLGGLMGSLLGGGCSWLGCIWLVLLVVGVTRGAWGLGPRGRLQVEDVVFGA